LQHLANYQSKRAYNYSTGCEIGICRAFKEEISNLKKK